MAIPWLHPKSWKGLGIGLDNMPGQKEIQERRKFENEADLQNNRDRVSRVQAEPGQKKNRGRPPNAAKRTREQAGLA